MKTGQARLSLGTAIVVAVACTAGCGSTGFDLWSTTSGDATSDIPSDTHPDWPADGIPDPTPDFPADSTDVIPDTVADAPLDGIPDPVSDPGFDPPPDPIFDTGHDVPADIPYDSGPPGIVGAACSSPSDCSGVPSSERDCVTDVFGMLTLPGGYCTAACTSSSECGSLGACVEIFRFGSYCLRTCTTSAACRIPEGYSCTTLPGSSGTYCLPPMPGPDSGPIDY